MLKDPILEDIWEIRETYARKFDYDLKAMFQDLKRKEKQSQRKVVSFSSKVEVEIKN